MLWVVLAAAIGFSYCILRHRQFTYYVVVFCCVMILLAGVGLNAGWFGVITDGTAWMLLIWGIFGFILWRIWPRFSNDIYVNSRMKQRNSKKSRNSGSSAVHQYTSYGYELPSQRTARLWQDVQSVQAQVTEVNQALKHLEETRDSVSEAEYMEKKVTLEARLSERQAVLDRCLQEWRDSDT